MKGKPPIEKNVIHKSLQVNNKGEIPIEKNISVVDEQGNEYEATYPKRAKGLVKSGRARFISENRICLASPPAKLSEVNNMENINNKANLQEVKKETAIVVNEAPAAEKPASAKYTLDYALEQLEKIREEEKAFSINILNGISEVQTYDGGDIGAQAKGMALEALSKEHGITSRKLIDFYLGMIDELKPSKESKTNKSEFLDFVKECTAKAGPGAALPVFENIWHVMNQ